MKKKGFTLVELLAVIVILAVLAFIAVPVVLNMIEEARIGSAEDSAYSYVKGIENSIVTGYLSGNDYTAGEYNIGDIKVDVKGSTPTSGKYELDSKNEVISGKFCINGYSIDYDGKHSTYNKDANYCGGSFNKSYKYGDVVYFNPNTMQSCTESETLNNKNTDGNLVGIKNGCMKWYVIENNDDTVDLILDHNTTDSVAWNTSLSKKGPNDALAKLSEDTSSWNEQLLRNDKYTYKANDSDYEYTIDYKNYKARLITANEVARITGVDKKLKWDEKKKFINISDAGNLMNASMQEFMENNPQYSNITDPDDMLKAINELYQMIFVTNYYNQETHITNYGNIKEEFYDFRHMMMVTKDDTQKIITGEDLDPVKILRTSSPYYNYKWLFENIGFMDLTTQLIEEYDRGNKDATSNSYTTPYHNMGYWTSTYANSNDGSKDEAFALYFSDDELFWVTNIKSTNSSSNIGIRPVITIDKTILKENLQGNNQHKEDNDNQNKDDNTPANPTHTQDDMETYNMKNINPSSPSMDKYGDYWHSKKYLGKIKKIYFVKTNEVPNGKIDTWDLSEKNNGKIKGWTVENPDSKGFYDLYIGSTGKIALPSDSFALFSNQTELFSIDFNNMVDTKNVVNMGHMFLNDYKLHDLDLSSFNTSNVTSMVGMFSGCSNLTTLNISSFVTNKVIDMSSMFSWCSSLTSLDLSHFNTSNVTDMSNMFWKCRNLATLNINSFDTSKVTNMYLMFAECSSLTTLDVSKFNTSKVTNMSYMFNECSSLTILDVSKFNTSNVTDMFYMFAGCSSLTTLNVSNFDTSKVTRMSGMFNNCSSLKNLDVSNFDTSKVTDMQHMFGWDENLTSLNVSHFNTSNVTNMNGMFFNCSSLTTLDLSNFNTNKVTNMSSMFSLSEKLSTIYVGNNWKINTGTETKDMFLYCGTNKTTLKN